MRSIKLAILVLFCAAPAFAQWPTVQVRQQNSSTRGSSPSTCNTPINVVSGNILVISTTWQTGSGTPSISDTRSSTWTQNLLDTSDTVRVMVATTTLGSSGAESITVTETSGAFMVTNCAEFPPNWSTTVDTSVTNTFSGTPSSVTCSTVTTTLNSDFIYSVIGGSLAGGNLLDPATSIANGWVQIGGAASSSAGYVFGGTNGSYNAKWTNTTNSSGTCATVAFQSNALAVTSPATLPDGGLSTAYSYTLTATGGKGAYTWSITSGSLQTGLSLNTSTGAITGTPTAGPQNSITFQVADTNSHTATEATTLKVSSALNAITFVQGKTQGSGVGTLAFTSNVTSGNLVVVNSGWSNGVTSNSCTDTLGTPLQVLFFENTQQSAVNTNRIMVSAGLAPSTGADTVTCATSVTGVSEFTNVSFLVNDNTGFTTGTTTSPATVTSNSLTTLVANELIVGSCQCLTGSCTMTVDSPFASVGSTNAIMNLGYRIVTTATGYTMSCDEASNTSGIWSFGLVALRPTGGAAAPAGGRGPKGKIL